MIRYTKSPDKQVKLKNVTEVNINDEGGYNLKLIGFGRICYTNAKIKRISFSPENSHYTVTLQQEDK